MSWLKQWQEEVYQQPISMQEKARCLLSQPTIEGWFMTCKLIQYMLYACWFLNSFKRKIDFLQLAI